jgi:hypothetical protein
VYPCSGRVGNRACKLCLSFFSATEDPTELVQVAVHTNHTNVVEFGLQFHLELLRVYNYRWAYRSIGYDGKPRLCVVDQYREITK